MSDISYEETSVASSNETMAFELQKLQELAAVLSTNLPILVDQIIPRVSENLEEIEEKSRFETWFKRLIEKVAFQSNSDNHDIHSERFQSLFEIHLEQLYSCKSDLAQKEKQIVSLTKNVTELEKHNKGLEDQLNKLKGKMQMLKRQSSLFSAELDTLCNEGPTMDVVSPRKGNPAEVHRVLATATPRPKSRNESSHSLPLSQSSSQSDTEAKDRNHRIEIEDEELSDSEVEVENFYDYKFVCNQDNCNQRFFRLGQLKTHLTTTHNLEKPLREFSSDCVWCGAMFQSQQERLSHRNSCRGMPTLPTPSSQSATEVISDVSDVSSCEDNLSDGDDGDQQTRNGRLRGGQCKRKRST